MANLFRASKASSGGGGATALTITSMPTKIAYSVGSTLDLTGLAVTATFDGGITADVTSAITTVPADGATLSTAGAQAVNVSYGGITTSFNVTVSTLPVSLNDASWQEIQDAARNGTLSEFASVGDTKEVTIDGNTYHMQLASINDGTGAAGTYYPNGTADFIAVELLPSTHVMNPTDVNVGGWNDSTLRTYLNETVHATLPNDLKAVIVEKTHMRTAGNRSTSLVSASDKLWLPTEWEVFGSATYSGESASYNKHYAIFSDANTRKKTRIGQSSVNGWWESSPVTSNENFCRVYTTGSTDNTNASNPIGVALCIRIG